MAQHTHTTYSCDRCKADLGCVPPTRFQASTVDATFHSLEGPGPSFRWRDLCDPCHLAAKVFFLSSDHPAERTAQLDAAGGGDTAPLCPICSGEPQLRWWERDRGLHPAIWHARYSCAVGGHIIAAPWADAGLGGSQGDPRIIEAARQSWSMTIAALSPQPASDDAAGKVA